MPKILVAIISIAFSLLIGFFCGALLTVPENSQMEVLIQKNDVFKKQMNEVTEENNELYDEIEMLEGKIQNLQGNLLKAYEENRQLKNRGNELVYPK